MICYASRTGTKRNIRALSDASWRFLITPVGDTSPPCLPYALDNGAWSAFQRSEPWDQFKFERMLARLADKADWVVAPDVVAGGLPSLELSVSWLDRLSSSCRLVLIAVQDGMTPDDLLPFIGPDVGIFLGGSTEWKLQTMQAWGDFCAVHGVHYHVARVNTLNRIASAHRAGAASIDGSSASRFAVSLPPLDFAARQSDLFDPRRMLAC